MFRWGIGTLAVLALVTGPGALAQEPDSVATAEVAADVPELGNLSQEELGERGAQLLESLRATIVDARRYNEQMAAATIEDSLVLRLQIARAEDLFMDDLKALFSLVNSPGGDRGDLRERTEAVFVEVTPYLWEISGDLRSAIDVLRAKRVDTAPAARSELEDRIRTLSVRLDAFVRYGLQHLGHMEELGLDVTADRALFETLLYERADELSGRMSLAQFRVRELGARVKETPGDAETEARLRAAHKSLQINTASMQTTVEVMNGMGLPAERFKAQLVTATQDLASGLLDVQVTATIVRRAWSGFTDWLSSEGPTFLVKLLLFAAIMFAGRLLARIVSRAVEKSLDRARVNMSALLKRMTVTAAKNAILALALVFGLAQLGISLGPLLAGFGVVGFILGFAMQDSLGNLAAGMMILINRPYDVGDVVEISGVFGKVENMSMVSTSILTLDNQKLVVPNSKIWGDVIKNVTDQRIRRVDMVFGISYTDDIPHAEEVLRGILGDHEKILDDPEPVVRLHTLNESSVDFIVRPWVPTDEYWNVYWDVTRAVKMRFDEEGVSIPFPQRDVHLYERKKLVARPEPLEDIEQEPIDESGTTQPDVNDE